MLVTVVINPCIYKIQKEFVVKDRTGSGSDYIYKDWFCNFFQLKLKKRQCKNCKFNSKFNTKKDD